MNQSNDVRGIVYCLAGGPLVLAWGLRKMIEKRLLENTPCSKVRSAAIGLVELQGTARQRKPLRSPLSNQDCSWWRCIVDELQSNGKSSSWVQIKEVDSQDLFYMEDETGRLLVDPTGAELHVPTRTVEWNTSTGNVVAPLLNQWGVAERHTWLGAPQRLRIREFSIPERSPIFVLGELVNNGNSIGYRSANFSDYLRVTKSNKQKMAEADVNHDGQVDPEEWDLFRTKLEDEFKEEERERAVAALTETTCVRKPTSQPLVISTKNLKELESTMTWQAPLGTFGGIAISGFGAWLAIMQGWPFWAPLSVIACGFLLGIANYKKGA